MAKRARPKVARTARKVPGPVRQTAPHPSSPAASRPPIPPTDVPDPQAVASFQKAMEALQLKQYRAAADYFRALLGRFPTERALLDRSRSYLEFAERELNRNGARPRTIEERITAATAALNTDQDDEAERLVRSVLNDDPQHDLALYLMAAVEARRGDQDAALTFLTRAIGISPEIRAQARYDSDFESLRRAERFQQLIDPPNHGGSRRPRRPK
jgi:tetratricopeptide (TPR) repeat protein